MAALASEQRPRAADAPSDEGAAVVALAVAVVVVTTPAGTGGKIGLEDGVDHAQRILDQRIAALADAVADQFKETAIDDLARREVALRTGRAVANTARMLWSGSSWGTGLDGSSGLMRT